jgi:hypothetical protein
MINVTNKFFISHYTGDRDIADILSILLSRITLNQIQSWFSSDTSELGGFKPGDIWFNKILEKIVQSKAVVIIITPDSVNRPWIYYESGIAQSLPDCEVIPICVGIKPDAIPAPLNMYQCYTISDYQSIKEFTSKLVKKFQITFDEGLARQLLKSAVTDIAKINAKKISSVKHPEIRDVLNELKIHIDNRFLSFFNGRESLIDKNANTEKVFLSYYITLTIKLPDGYREHYIEISENDTFQYIADQMFFLLDNNVDAYTYLNQWIILEKETSKRIVINEIAYRIPATLIFDPNFEYIIELLDKPYSGNESSFKRFE